MSWFDEQIRYRKLKDEELLSETYVEIASAIMGRRLQQAWQDESYAAKSALETICKYYHVKFVDIPKSIKDLNGQLDYCFQPHGITRRSVVLKPGWQNDAVGAMLGTRDGKVVALIPGKTGGYTFEDIESGNLVKVNKQNASWIDEEAVVFYRPFPLRSISIKDVFLYMLESINTSDILWYLVCLGLVTLIGLLTPKLNHILFSDVVDFQSQSLLIAVMIFMVCVTISMQLFGIIKELYLSRINTKLNISVQAATMMRVLSLPADFFRNYTAGELNTYVNQMNQLSSLLVGAIFSTGFTGVFSLVYIFQIFKYAKALVLPALLITLLTLIFSIITVFAQMKNAKVVMRLSAKEKGMVYSTITGIQKIRLSGAENRAFARWGKLYAEEAKVLYDPPALLKFNGTITMAISLIGTIIMYFAAAKSGISVADYYAFNASYAYVTTAFAALAGIAQATASIRPILDMIDPLLKASPEISQDKEVVTKLSGRIELSHVSFKYPGSDQLILNDVNLKIRAGQYVAIVGKTGCGKSTLMRLLMGFEKPIKGAIYYDGKDLDKLDKKSIRRKIGVVLQNGKLINDDIFSNITISAPWLKLDDAWRAAEIAGIADDIRAMPMGMNTVIQEGSGGISGGQRQRIMIARAIAPKPKILFLDEATSALDNITQKHVSDSMEKMKCTRIVIAHRLSTIKQCDRIIVLDGGKIIEDGSYDQLIEQNGFFAQLVERQRIDK
ncbi:MAG: ATP-binding cassette domain-containing protein [Holdemanella sp.]|nr:ATP-binding cassette domain-containing protein [Holdemanella sp.]